MFESIKRLSFKHKNNKFHYYLISYLRMLTPGWFYQRRLKAWMASLAAFDEKYVRQRVDYYNKLNGAPVTLSDAKPLRALCWPKRQKAYYFDTLEIARYFKLQANASWCFGDVTHVPEQPSLVKSRPIKGDNTRSVLLKINKSRHFYFVNDPRQFRDKEPLMIGRFNINQAHRADFMAIYFDHPLCDIGDVSTRKLYPQWQKPRLTIDEHLKYQFILCLEGNDVASNLKWVMSSNSLAVMPAPTYETWFMEGTLIPNYHYVAIKADYSDLEERLTYYMTHTEEAEAILAHAHDYVKPFMNTRQEHLISLLVLKKYFVQTGQQAILGDEAGTDSVFQSEG
jgi:hypothetical protein